MSFYEDWIGKKEQEGLAKHIEYKLVHDFDWGLNHLGIESDEDKTLEFLVEFNKRNIEDSANYFVPPKLSIDKYRLEDGELSFTSTVKSYDNFNNVVYCSYFPAGQKETAVIIVPHWNSTGLKYNKICKLMNAFNFSSIRISLPFHDKRGGPEAFKNGVLRSTLMVSANIGLTLLTMRQIVQDIISVINWLELQGYKKIGIMGSSIGSCAAFIAAVHDARVCGLFTNLMSSYFGEVVWNGISTTHIRKSVEPHMTLTDLRKLWLLNSPIAYVDKIRQYNPRLKQFIVAARYDKTFPFYLIELLFKAYDEHRIKYDRAILPCGHYTIAKSIFKYIDAYYILRFFNGLFKSGT